MANTSFNATWLYHEVCNQLFPKTKSITRTKLFVIYLHALSSHAAPQYERICMKSTNAEHEERLFVQAKDIAHRTTDRKANSIIPHILMRLQAKQLQGDI